MTQALVSKKRSDYTKPSHLISEVQLQFELFPEQTTVSSNMQVQRIDLESTELSLDGEELTLLSISIDGQSLLEGSDYVLDDSGLRIFVEKDNFNLCIVNSINPKDNTSLEGLYYSNKAFCTQCEAEGFRKITYFLDRPDVLSVYTVTIVTSTDDITYALSNGNLISDSGFLNGKRTRVWHDPHPKPCYLFALVAGHFDKLVDTFTTCNGRQVALELFVDEGRKGQGQHALDSLKKAMQWDEETYGLEYDLDIYMVVAVDFFNMGAMENKGLNVFNSKFVLADANTATDTDYFNIESIIAHEYFHNWTGNRVTCRDWFQLSLKEGLTVFRDQQFSADMASYLSTRIDQVKIMREHQFAEDAGPMSHPIRPDEVMEMNNFYTVTVYDKGAEVIRMLHTLLGKNGFRKGMDLYFQRHDGCAVTCDDFVNAMQDANNHDLSHFKRWYGQSGTPNVEVSEKRDDMGQVSLIFTQINMPTTQQAHKSPLYIPIKLECFTDNGEKLDLGLEQDTFVLSKEMDTLSLGDFKGNVTPSLLQDFSAPVVVNYAYQPSQLLNILENANSDYAKWEAAQRFFFAIFVDVYRNSSATTDFSFDKHVTSIDDYTRIIENVDVSIEVLAQLLAFPSIEASMSQIEQVLPLKALRVHQALVKQLAKNLHGFCQQQYLKVSIKQAYQYNVEQVRQRELKSVCLKLLAHGADFSHATANDCETKIRELFSNTDNMTEKLCALQAAQILANNGNNDVFHDLMLAFEAQYKSDAVVMDKWFSLHATSERQDVLSHLDLLQSHQQFSAKNPNKVRALIGSFAFFNTAGFHHESGSGYKYLADYLLQIDQLNPQIASRLITPLIQHAKYNNSHQSLMVKQLQRIFTSENLSKDLFEKVSKTLSQIA